MNNRSTILTIFISLILILFFTAQSFEKDAGKSSTEVGRYQLFEGSYIVIDAKNKRSDKETSVFLLDTSTGKVKKYFTGLSSEGEIIEEWRTINK